MVFALQRSVASSFSTTAPAPLVGIDDVAVTQIQTSPKKFRVEFQGALARTPLALMTATLSGLTGITITRFQSGDAFQNEIQDIELPATLPNLAFFRLTFQGQQTGAIQVSLNSGDIRADRIRIHLCKLSNIGSIDNTDQLQAWLDSIPNGATAGFPMGAVYRCDWGLRLANKVGVTLDLNGAEIMAIASLSDYDPSGSNVQRKQLDVSLCTSTTVKNGTIRGAWAVDGYHQDVEQEANLKISGGSSIHVTAMMLRTPCGDNVQWAGVNKNSYLVGLEVDGCTFDRAGRGASSTGGFNRDINFHDNIPTGPYGRFMCDIEQTNQEAVTENFSWTDTDDDVTQVSGELLNWIACGGLGKIRGLEVARCTTRRVKVASGTQGRKYTKVTTNGVGTFQLVVFNERQHITFSPALVNGNAFTLTVPAVGTTGTITFTTAGTITQLRTDIGNALSALVGQTCYVDNFSTSGGDVYFGSPAAPYRTNVGQMTVNVVTGAFTATVTSLEDGGQTTASINDTLTGSALATAVLNALLALPSGDLVSGQVTVDVDPNNVNAVFVDFGHPSLDVEVPPPAALVAGGCTVVFNSVDRFDYSIHDNVGTLPVSGNQISLSGQDGADIFNNIQAWGGGANISVGYGTDSINVGGARTHDNDTTPPGHWTDN